MEEGIVYRCKCGQDIPDLGDFRRHLWDGGKADGKGVHASMGKFSAETGAQVELPWREQKLKEKEERQHQAKSGDGRGKPVADGAEKEVAFVAVSGTKPAVIFRIADENIPLVASHLYEAYIMYLDIKTRHGVENSFSDCLLAGMETLWQLTVRPRVKEGGVIIDDGHSEGSGESLDGAETRERILV